MQNFYIENNETFLNETYRNGEIYHLHELENIGVKSQFFQMELIKLNSN